MYYNNEFPYKNIPATLWITKVEPVIQGIDVKDDAEIVNIRFAAALARDMNTFGRTIASRGGYIISEQPLGTIEKEPSFHVSFFFLKDVKSKIVEEKEITLSEDTSDYFKYFLNRCVANLLWSRKYHSDGDFFWLLENEQELGSGFSIIEGFTIRTVIDVPRNDAFLLVDTAASNISKETVMDAINRVVKNKDLNSWHELTPADVGFFFGQGVRATYETMNSDGEMEHRHYKVKMIDPSRSISEATLEDGVTSVMDYINMHGYDVSDPDQPVVVSMSGNGTLLVPSLISRTPGPKELKSVSSAISKKAADIAKKDPASKAFLILEFIKYAIENGLVDNPIPVNVEVWNPKIVMGSESLDIKSEADFKMFFAKGQLATCPEWDNIILCHDVADVDIVQKFASTLVRVAKKFKLPLKVDKQPFSSTLAKGKKPYLRDYENFIMNKAEAIQDKTILSWISPVSNDEWYATLKRDLVIRKEIPTQQLLENKVKNAKNIEWDYVNPLFLQMVAKMGGFPYLFPKAMTFKETVFIGIDRFVDNTREAPSVTAATACFSNQGEYLGASTTDLDAKLGDDFSSATSAISTLIDDLKARQVPFSRVIILRDGTRYGLEDEINLFSEALQSASVKGMIVTANKSYPIRIFKGDTFDFVDENIEQYLSILDYHRPTSFVVASTEVTAGGMARPILYNIEWHDFDEDLPTIKASLARAIIAFTRMNWSSIRGNQLPAPLQFAHRLAEFCGLVKSPWPRQIIRPLFL
ncbi:MAG TPA: Piwi domain-containing protein [Candidatus Lokiarchaeia archaeon]|nr:Piwi domain-containing protein [Candidatus Lokiarchaeia archaeon]